MNGNLLIRLKMKDKYFPEELSAHKFHKIEILFENLRKYSSSARSPRDEKICSFPPSPSSSYPPVPLPSLSGSSTRPLPVLQPLAR